MRSVSASTRTVILTIGVLSFATFIAVAPAFFETNASKAFSGTDDVTHSWDAKIPNYDIRTDKRAFAELAAFRASQNKSAAEVADIRDAFVRGEEKLKQSVPSLKVEYSPDIETPEVIGPDVKQGEAFLTEASSSKRSDVLLNFLKSNDELTGVAVEQVSQLIVAADYKNPENDLAFVELNQVIDGVPVFRGEAKAGFAKNGEIIRVINNLAAGLSYEKLSKDFGDPAAAVNAAAELINHQLAARERIVNQKASTELKAVFGDGDFAVTAEKMYFPTEPGVAIPAWRVLIWKPVNAFYVIVDAASGTMLWRKNITEDQTTSATYNVYANPNAMINVADSPFPMTPGPTSPNGAQAPGISRTSITRIGNEPPYTFNNNGWLTDGVNITDGNAVQAGLDRDTANGVDATNGMATGNPDRTFDYPINPGMPVASGSPFQGDWPLLAFTLDPADVDINTNAITETAHGFLNGWPVRFTPAVGGAVPSPLSPAATYFVVNATANQFSVSTTSGGAAVDLTSVGTGTHTLSLHPAPCMSVPPQMTDYQRAIVTQLFYITNWYHDETYRLGFTEQARNFQNDNFGRGGSGADRVSAEAQDCAGTNNANFGTPADGGRGRMQMYLWTNPTPDFDGSLDADIVIHELTHGLSNRLHGNGSGLGGLNMSRGMGEGWSDFYAHALLSESSDPINGIYTLSGYATYPRNNFNNYYYGIRRFPKAVMAFTGPNGRPHNPLTFNDVDSTKINVTDGAFAAAFNTTSDQVHAAGEVWSTALWEIRAKYITRLGWFIGNRQVLQHVMDGMKLAPLTPTFLQERDAIIAGVLANGTQADVADVWAGFAIRGMGFSATIENSGGSSADGSGTGLTRVTEAFDLPNLTQTPTFTASDAPGDNDGIFEPGEPVNLTIPLTNITGTNATGVTLQVNGGPAVNYGTINHNSSGQQVILFTIPSNTPCGSALTLTFAINSNIGLTNVQRTLQIGSPVTTFTESFDGVTAPAFPANWTATSVQSGITFVTTANNVDSAPNAAFALDPTTVGGGTDLTSPIIPITAQAAILTFRNRYDTEAGWDGGVLDISINGGAFQDIVTAGGTFLENGYNGSLGTGTNNPLNGRSAWTGNSNGYVTSRVRLPAAAAGQNVQLRFRFGADNNTVGVGPNPGWYIDNVQVAGQASCSFSASNKSRADFDGDGKSDLSVFRPADNNWYVRKSAGGIDVIGWGLSGDRIVPGKYDGDNKDDFAIFRPNENRWYVLGSNGYTVTLSDWGIANDLTVPADYDGDGKTDFAVFRPAENNWYIRKSGGGVDVWSWGLPGDVPVTGDFNGDGKADLTVYRAGTWLTAFTSGGIAVNGLGTVGDQLVPADFDGDNTDDLAIWRPSTGEWHIRRSSNGATDVINWGLSADVPAPGDFDGDGRDDPAVYRNGTWHLRMSTAGILSDNWGITNDKPIPSGYIP